METSTAQTAIGSLSLGLGLAAVAAPRTVAAGFGVDADANPALTLLTRFIGIRNATMGATLLQADSDTAVRQALGTGLAVGASDVLAVVVAARSGVLSRRSAAVALVLLGGIAAVEFAGLRD